jgi:hypothetical protein
LILPASIDSIKERNYRTDEHDCSASPSEKTGFFVISDQYAVLIDLHPRYLSHVIGIDSWQHPYRYQGERDHFTVRSVGPDGKVNTDDDIVVSGSKRQ